MADFTPGTAGRTTGVGSYAAGSTNLYGTPPDAGPIERWVMADPARAVFVSIEWDHMDDERSPVLLMELYVDRDRIASSEVHADCGIVQTFQELLRQVPRLHGGEGRERRPAGPTAPGLGAREGIAAMDGMRGSEEVANG